MHSRFSIALVAAMTLVFPACEASKAPKVPPAGVTAAPPPPPGAPTAPSTATGGVAASSATDKSGLPADLITKIDALIQAHKDYTALAEKVQNVEDFKLHRDELSQIAQRSSDALDDVMIASTKLTASQKSKWEAYMNQHVTPINDVRRREYERVQALLP